MIRPTRTGGSPDAQHPAIHGSPESQRCWQPRELVSLTPLPRGYATPHRSTLSTASGTPYGRQARLTSDEDVGAVTRYTCRIRHHQRELSNQRRGCVNRAGLEPKPCGGTEHRGQTPAATRKAEPLDCSKYFTASAFDFGPAIGRRFDKRIPAGSSDPIAGRRARNASMPFRLGPEDVNRNLDRAGRRQ